jgi:hypothetical protein
MNLETELNIVKTVDVVKPETKFETETENAPIPTELSLSSAAVET